MFAILIDALEVDIDDTVSVDPIDAFDFTTIDPEEIIELIKRDCNVSDPLTDADAQYNVERLVIPATFIFCPTSTLPDIKAIPSTFK
jgi:hypothetical protein